MSRKHLSSNSAEKASILLSNEAQWFSLLVTYDFWKKKYAEPWPRPQQKDRLALIVYLLHCSNPTKMFNISSCLDRNDETFIRVYRAFQHLSIIRVSFCINNLWSPSSALLTDGSCEAYHTGSSLVEGISMPWEPSWEGSFFEGEIDLRISRLLPGPTGRLRGKRLKVYEQRGWRQTPDVGVWKCSWTQRKEPKIRVLCRTMPYGVWKHMLYYVPLADQTVWRNKMISFDNDSLYRILFLWYPSSLL